MSNDPSKTSATPTPYRTALEHLGDRIAHANDLTAAYAARMAAYCSRGAWSILLSARMTAPWACA